MEPNDYCVRAPIGHPELLECVGEGAVPLAVADEQLDDSALAVFLLDEEVLYNHLPVLTDDLRLYRCNCVFFTHF